MAMAHTYKKKLWVEGVASMAAFEKKRSRLKLCMVWWPLVERYGMEVGHTKT